METPLHRFQCGVDGSTPNGGLLDVGGTLYGITAGGGATGRGTISKLPPDGTLTTLYAFAGGVDGDSPNGDLIKLGAKLYEPYTLAERASARCSRPHLRAPST